MIPQQQQQLLTRTVLRKAPAAHAAAAAAPEVSSQTADEGHALAGGSLEDVGPFCLLNASSWTMHPQAFSELVLVTNPDFSVVGVLGSQGLGRSAFLNRLLGFEGELPAAGPHPTPAFPVAPAAAAAAAGRHCTRGIGLRISCDRILALDTQPLFSASVLEDMISGWDQPPPALAVPAVAAAADAKAAAVPYEGVQALAELQTAALLLSACHRVLVFCDGMEDQRTWGFLLTAEMLCRGIPDPSLPRDQGQPAAAAASGAAGTAASAAAGQQQQQQLRQSQPPPQEHLAEVVFVHVLPAGSAGQQGQGAAGPSVAQLQLLEQQLHAFFASSRLCRPGPLRMLNHLAPSSSGGASGDASRGASAGARSSSSGGGGSGQGISYWVLPALQDGVSGAAEGAWAVLVAQLLERPCPAFARPCSERGWLRGTAGDVWRAVRKSPDIATFYSRLARTQLKGAGGWGLAR